MKKILFLLGDIWSMEKNKGMPSVFKILEASDKKFNITIFTTDKNRYTKELPNANIYYFNNLPLKFNNNYISYLVTRMNNIILNIKYIFQFMLTSKDYDLLYCSSSMPIYSTIFIKTFYSIKTIHRIYGTFLFPKLGNKFDQFKKFEEVLIFKSKADKYIITDDGTFGDKVAEYYKIDSNKIAFLRNGVTKINSKLSKKDILNKYSLEDNCFYLLSVSRLVKWKRVDRIINAMNRIDNSKIKLLIAGDGEEKSSLQNLSQNDNIIFLGSISSNEVQELMSCVDVFISMYDLSNIGNPLLEALTHNLPIITYDSGNTKSIINNKNGILISSTNEEIIIEELKNNIMYLYNNPEEKEKLIENVKDYTKNELYTWEDRIKKEIEIMENLINEK